MMISSTIQKYQVPPFTQIRKAEEEVKASFVDSFTQAASSEMPRALLYTTTAGATAGLVTSFLTQGIGVPNLAQAAGFGAAAGAGVGLIATIGASIFAALSSEGKEALKPNPDWPIAPPRQEPIVTPPTAPQPTPEKLFQVDAQEVGETLSRRLQYLGSLVEAEKVMNESLGRRGRDIYQQAEVQVEKAKSEHASKTQARPPIVALKEDVASGQNRLAALQTESRQALQIQLEGEKISSETLGRRGRFSSGEGKQLYSDLQNEIQRLEAALQSS